MNEPFVYAFLFNFMNISVLYQFDRKTVLCTSLISKKCELSSSRKGSANRSVYRRDPHTV